jgi:purine-binding chemotaxis protein CheW
MSVNVQEGSNIVSAELALSSYIHSVYGLDTITEPVAESVQVQVADAYPEKFEVMVFSVSGINLAIEPEKIQRISMSADVGTADIFRASASSYDLAALIRPGGPPLRAEEDNILFQISIQSLQYPVLCESIGEIVRVNKSDVNWRSSAGKRLWLAGTIPKHQCALLDVQELQKSL